MPKHNKVQNKQAAMPKHNKVHPVIFYICIIVTKLVLCDLFM